MKVVLDADVEKVMQFMQREIQGEKLLFVARAIAKVAELAWADAIPRQANKNAIEMTGD
jgi:hypothetical protein